MKFDFVPKLIHSKKENKDYYGIVLVLKKEDKILQESKVLLWISEEEYNEMSSNK